MKTKPLTLYFLPFIVGAIAGCTGPEPTYNTDRMRQPITAKKDDPNSADAAFRKFMLALYDSDLDALHAVTVPNEDLALLINDEPRRQEEIDSAKDAISKMGFRKLKVGDKLTVPGVGVVIMDESRINENRQQIFMPGHPLPRDVVRIDGQWRVNVDDIIDSIKEAQRIRSQDPRRSEPAQRK